jgi:phytanoyl-CoA hydroxylase
MLEKRDIDEYREQGALVVPGVVDEPARERMRAVLARLVDAARSVERHDDVYDLEPSHTRAEPRVRRIKRPHAIDPVFAELLRSERMLSILRALVGENVRLHNSKLNLKAPRIGAPVQWHQDWAFYPHTHDDLLAVGVMLDDTTRENGALLVMPGTHRGPIFDHHDAQGYFCGALDPESCGLDFSKAIACEGPAGSCSFHHVRLVHGSAQNTSERGRALLLYEIAAADAYPLLGVPDYDDFKQRLLCGRESLQPRLREVPIRMPFPPARNQGSIYENQSSAKAYFGMSMAAGQ